MSANNNSLFLQNKSGPLSWWNVTTTPTGPQMGNASGVMEDAGGHDLNPGPSWFAMSIGGDYIAWQNTDGTASIWHTDGDIHVLGGGIVDDSGGHAVNPGPTWHIKSTGDFGGAGGANVSFHDLVWQNDNGTVAIWQMSGGDGNGITGGGVVDDSGGHAVNPGPTWHVKSTGDFSAGSGNHDIVLQNDNGTVAIWDMGTAATGPQIVGGGVVDDSGGHAVNPGPTWHVEATGHFSGGGPGDNHDIVLQNDDGTVAIWQMNASGQIVGGGIVDDSGGHAVNPGPTWHVKETGQYSGDASIVLQNDNGTVAVWHINMTGTGPQIAADSGVMDDSGGHPLTPDPSLSVINSNGNSMRFIHSGAANEVLAAPSPTSDEFVFTSFAAGTHTITGFNPVQDVIEFSKAQFASFAAVEAAITPVAGGAAINLGGGSSLQLPGVSPTSLHASDFVLV